MEIKVELVDGRIVTIRVTSEGMIVEGTLYIFSTLHLKVGESLWVTGGEGGEKALIYSSKVKRIINP